MEDETLEIITNTLIKYSEQLTSLQKDILKLQREVDLLIVKLTKNYLLH